LAQAAAASLFGSTEGGFPITVPSTVLSAPRTEKKLKFGEADAFQVELRRRVEGYFQSTGRPQRDCPEMYLKTAIILSVYAASYGLLVFYAAAWWQALALAVLLGLTTAAIGFSIQHDGAHKAYSDRMWINNLMAMSLDLIGGSSYIWHWKHDIFHHTYVNITGHDADIDLGVFGRLSTSQKRRSWHRWQHYYLWPLYGFLAIKWHFVDDFRDVITGRIGERKIPRPRGKEWAVFFGGKAFFFTLAFVIPSLFHPFWIVACFYGVVAVVTGVTLSMVFQVVHVVEEAEFPSPMHETGNMEKSWAVHQVEETVDYARNSRVAVWLVGALNFQIEHHLFPRVCHTNYPAISKMVEATCKEYGVRFSEHASYRAGLASHFRLLRKMGVAPDAVPLRGFEPRTSGI
jgi:linoleoyl-CoA desaturase